MMRFLPFFLAVSLFAAGIRTGTFPIEIKQSYSSAEGLADNQVSCVAVAGTSVYAGTAKGLSVFEGERWKPVSGQPVEVCGSGGTHLYYTSGGALHRLSDGRSERLAALPAGTVRAVAAGTSAVYVAVGKSLYALRAKTLEPVTGAQLEARQVAVSASGAVAVAAAEGLFLRDAAGKWTRLYPRAGARSWNPVDARGVAYDAKGLLWVATPQGAGCFDGTSWKLLTGEEGLPYDDFTTVTPGEPGVLWFGTTKGAIRYDGSTWEYRQGKRWLADDQVRQIAVTSNGDAWFAGSGGASVIRRKPTTLAEKARYYEDEIDKRHRRTPYGYVMAVRLEQPGDKSNFTQHDSDNDGLWTSMYGAGECFAYAATKDPLAKQRAKKAFDALRFLSTVTQAGEHPAPKGFPARAILPVDGPDPNIHDSKERDERTRAHRDHLWKILSPRWPKNGPWYWKTDTSSDELDGHYFFYAQYYDLATDTEAEKEEVREVVRAITDHLLEHDFKLVDWDGTPTRWGIFDPVSLNDDRAWWAGRGLNALSILSYLKVAEHLTGDAKYTRAYEKLIRDHKYASNMMVAKISAGPGSGNQSDDEMAFMSYYDLIQYETNDDLLQKYSYSLANYWHVERPEMNPFFNFVAAASLKGKKFEDAFRTQDLTLQGDWLEDSVDTLKRLPLDRVDWRHENAQRKDLVPVRSFVSEDDERRGFGYRRNGKVLPVDERFFEFWNHNPYRLNTGGGGRALGDGAVYLLPYYMGLYHGYIE